MEDLLVKYGAILGKRYTLKQRQRFLLSLNEEFTVRGYKTRFANNDRKNNARAVDLFVGDIGSAKTIVCCHYDTPQKALIPNYRYYPLNGQKSFQRNFVANLIPSLLTTACGAGVFYFIINNYHFQGFWPAIILIAVVIVVFFADTLISVLTANKYNINRNTASVLAILETAKQLTKETKNKVAFILLDKGCGDNSGTLMLRQALPTTLDKKLFIYLDCIANGQVVVLAHKENLRKESEKLQKNFIANQNIEVKEVDDGDVIYTPAFFLKRSITITAGNYDKNGNLYVTKINSNKDRQPDIDLIKAIITMLADSLNS